MNSSIQQLQKKETTFFNRAESLFNSENYDLAVVESLKAIEIAAQKYLLDHGHIPSRKSNYSWIKILDEKKLVPHEMIENLLCEYAGVSGNIISRDCSRLFDEKKHSILGIKWYHYLWYPVIIYLILIQGFFISFLLKTKDILYLAAMKIIR